MDSNLLPPAGSEEAPDQDSLDGSPAALAAPRPPSPPPQHSKTAAKAKRQRRHTKESPSSSESGDEAGGQQPQQQQPAKTAVKATMDRAHSNFSHKSQASKVSKGTKVGAGVRPQGKVLQERKRSLQLSPFSGILWDRREPFTQLWVTLSAMYGKLLVLLMFAFCLIEVMDNKVPPLTFQGFFMMYLYCGSIIAIMCIYITVLLDNCPSVTNSRENLTTAGDPEVKVFPNRHHLTS